MMAMAESGFILPSPIITSFIWRTWMPFKGVDFYRIDDLLTDEERMVRDTVRRFVDDRVIPIIGKHFEDGTFPKELIPELAQLGLFGGNLPEEYGSANMNNIAYGLVMQELERGDSG